MLVRAKACPTCGCTPPGPYIAFESVLASPNTIGSWDSATVLNCAAASDFDVLTQVAADTSVLNSSVRILFMGNVGNTIAIPEADWPDVLTYLQNGGRVWLETEFENPFTVDGELINDFLAAMGSMMVWEGGAITSGCSQDGSRDMIPGSANIVQGMGTPTRCAGAAEVSGGTTMFFSPLDGTTPLVAVEQIGDGFLFLSGDGSVLRDWHSCDGYDHCELVDRLLTYADGDII